MPILTLRTNRSLTEDAISKLANDLSSITEIILEKDPEVTVVRFVSEEGSHRWFLNKQPQIDTTIFELDIVITVGANSDDQKAEWIRRAWKVVCNVLGENTNVNYISVNEVDGSAWGYNGITQHQRKIDKAIIREATK